MRILVVGAGAVGGYFGGRLLEAGRDVTFLVRPRRAAQLAAAGLVIRSPCGDVALPAPTVNSEQLREPFDAVLLSCKAYDLQGAIAAFAPAVGRDTAVLPLLNGMRHLEALEERFGRRAVMGAQCFISTTLDDEGRIVHLNELHGLTFGELDGSSTPRAEALASTLSGAKLEAQLSREILQVMWEKWVFIAAGAGLTCLMRASVGEYVEAGAAPLAEALLEECAAIATAEGHPPGAAFLAKTRAMFTSPASGFTASTFRDVERGARTEVEHLLGDLLRRGGDPATHPLLRLAYLHLASYEVRRGRAAASGRASL